VKVISFTDEQWEEIEACGTREPGRIVEILDEATVIDATVLEIMQSTKRGEPT
jgi:hypothetical protein